MVYFVRFSLHILSLQPTLWATPALSPASMSYVFLHLLSTKSEHFFLPPLDPLSSFLGFIHIYTQSCTQMYELGFT